MPKEYKECVKTEKKKHSEKDAKRICAISYWKRHGVSVNEAHKRSHKALGDYDMEKFITLARSKESLLNEVRRIAKAHGVDKDAFIILPIPKELRNNEKLKAIEPDITDTTYKYMLVRKSVGGKDFVVLTVEGQVKLDVGALPENPLAAEMNDPERSDLEETVDVAPKTKSMSSECKGKGCEEKEEEKEAKDEEKPEDVKKGKKREEVSKEDEFVDAKPEHPEVISKAQELADAIKGILEAAQGTDLQDEIVKTFTSALSPVQKSEEASSQPLSEVMEKVRNGESLSDLERAMVSAAVDAVKKETGDTSSRSSKDTLDKVMAKVAKGEELSEEEKKIVSAATDAAKKAKTEVAKSLTSALEQMVDVDETLEGIYKSLMGNEPPSGIFAFTNKAEANRFREVARVKGVLSATEELLVTSIGVRTRRALPNKYKFVAILED